MNKKLAFSLIEVLLVMGIIAVVTALGLSLSKKGMEKAYNQYWYTGYQALYDGTNDAIMKGVFAPNDKTSVQNFIDYATHIGQTLLKCPDFHVDTTTNHGFGTVTFTARNGIHFEIAPSSMSQQNNGPWQLNVIRIAMTIPKPVTKTSGVQRASFIFVLGNGYPRIPYPINGGVVNLQNRVDLLPFYVKDDYGKLTGEYYGFRDAYCRVNTSLSGLGSEWNINCAGITQDKSSFGPVNPRKIY